MKKIIHFSKAFVPCVILSLTLIVLGVVGLFTKGLNMGIDFKPGLIEEVRIAPTALELNYKGTARVTIELTNTDMKLIVSGIGADNQTVSFPYVKYGTVGALATALNEVEGVTATPKVDTTVSTIGMFANSEVSTVLGLSPYRVHYNSGSSVDIETVRNAVAGIEDASVKAIGSETERSFQIRVGDDGSSTEISKKLQDIVSSALTSAFGEENVAVVKTDFIGAQFSASLATNSIILVVLTLLLIWLYATIRFHWDFALGAVLAILHDALIMVAFITWSGLEFNSTMIAAILTIIGYSINDTVVVLDRIRENMKIVKTKNFKDILDISQSETLGRTIITTVTTLLAVCSLYFFTTGSMKEFALALIVGMISGVYSTITIAGAVIAFCRRNWSPSDEEKKTQFIAVEDIEANI